MNETAAAIEDSAFARSAAADPPRQALKTRYVVAAVAGNALEFYDFTTYAFFAAQIGRAFFPAHRPLDSLLMSLATFGAGFVTRPVGALVIGRIGDRAGRRPAMLLSFFLMGVAILGLALCPSYAAIGPAAPVLVVAVRLLQGFALGGEVGPTTAYLLEAAPPLRRGLYAAQQSVSQNVASLVGGLVGYALASLLSARELDAYGWRLAFLVGALALPFGWLVRRSMPETLHLRDPVPDVAETGRSGQLRVVLCSIGILCGGTVATYVQNYMTTYSDAVLHMQVKVAFTATIIYGLVGVAANVLGAALSDRIGRKPVMIVPRILLIASIVPAFWLLGRNRDAATLAGVTAVLTAFASTSGAPIMAALTESLRRRSRSVVLAVVYAGAIAVFGGTTQLAVTWLIGVTGDVLCPAYYYVAASLVALVAMALIRESAPARLAGRFRTDTPA